MRERTRGFAILDQRIEELGKENVIADIVSRVAEGDAPHDIARSYGVPYYCIRSFVESECADDIALALRARADIVEHQGTQAVMDADVDTVAVARLQGEYLLKLASKLDKARYGDKPDTSGGNAVQQLPTFVVNFISSQSQQIERVVASEPCRIIDQEGVLIEQST